MLLVFFVFSAKITDLATGRVKESVFCMTCRLREVMLYSDKVNHPFIPSVITRSLKSMFVNYSHSLKLSITYPIRYRYTYATGETGRCSRISAVHRWWASKILFGWISSVSTYRCCCSAWCLTLIFNFSENLILRPLKPHGFIKYLVADYGLEWPVMCAVTTAILMIVFSTLVWISSNRWLSKVHWSRLSRWKR